MINRMKPDYPRIECFSMDMSTSEHMDWDCSSEWSRVVVFSTLWKSDRSRPSHWIDNKYSSRNWSTFI